MLQKLADYNCWANARVLKRFGAIAQNGTPLPPRAVHLFSHVLNAQWIWIARVTGTQSPVTVFQYHDLAALRPHHEQTCPRLVELVRQADEVELNRVIEYTNTQGKGYATPVSEIFLHCFNHATYHRAQVALALREVGLEPINTDYITWVREQMGQE